jgi:hypothetical protein
MRRLLPALLLCCAAHGHDVITTAITWNREISRLVYTHCASCHHPGGMAFSLLTYKEARPWAEAIKEEVLARRMPPWGAIKGFGDFRNDQALTPEEMEIVTSWADGGVPEGEDKDLATDPKIADPFIGAAANQDLVLTGDLTIKKPTMVDGLMPLSVPEHGSFQLIATFPDGSVQPLLWLDDYKPQFGHPFLFRTPVELPVGTSISGVPAGAKIAILKPQPPSAAEPTRAAGP